MFTFDQLRCFVVLAETLHFGRAAEKLTMTQPPLSRQIKNLEKSLGVSLLSRTNRNVELTPAGQIFLREAKIVLADAERAGEYARMASEGLFGSLRVGYTSTAGAWLLGKMLGHMREHMPQVSIEVFEMVTSAQVKALKEHRIDIGLARLSAEDDSSICYKTVHREALMLATPLDHELLKTEKLSREMILGQPLLMYSPDEAHYFHELVVRYFPSEYLNQVLSLSQIPTMLSLVLQGHGIALVPESVSVMRYENIGFRYFDDLPKDLVEMGALCLKEGNNPVASRAVGLLQMD